MNKLSVNVILAGALVTLGCAAVYPEVMAPVRGAQGRTLEPPPPADLVYLRFDRADIPEHTRDGRDWGAAGGATPDSFARFFVDDREIFRTSVASGTLKPT